MKHYIIKTLILCILSIGVNAFGQSRVKEAQYKQGDASLWKFLDKKFGEEARKHEWPPCLVSTIFAKFTIDSVGNVKGLVFSELKGTPQVFRTMLEATILATNGLWIPSKINGKAVESKPYILPLIYDIESGCAVAGPEGKRVYKPISNDLITALRCILEFQDNVGGNPTQLNCILLKPLHIFSIN